MGDIMAMTAAEIETLIRQKLPDSVIDITDLAGDGNHYQASISSAEFAGKSKLQQHKMVYDALGDRMGGELHALSIKTTAKT